MTTLINSFLGIGSSFKAVMGSSSCLRSVFGSSILHACLQEISVWSGLFASCFTRYTASGCFYYCLPNSSQQWVPTALIFEAAFYYKCCLLDFQQLWMRLSLAKFYRQLLIFLALYCLASKVLYELDNVDLSTHLCLANFSEGYKDSSILYSSYSVLLFSHDEITGTHPVRSASAVSLIH